MWHESEAILHLIFEHYEEAVLLLCRSAGAVWSVILMLLFKAKSKKASRSSMRRGLPSSTKKLLGLLISAQFDSYRRIVAECPDRKTAERYMDAMTVYHFGGWATFFESVNKLREKK